MATEEEVEGTPDKGSVEMACENNFDTTFDEPFHRGFGSAEVSIVQSIRRLCQVMMSHDNADVIGRCRGEVSVARVQLVATQSAIGDGPSRIGRVQPDERRAWHP